MRRYILHAYESIDAYGKYAMKVYDRFTRKYCHDERCSWLQVVLVAIGVRRAYFRHEGQWRVAHGIIVCRKILTVCCSTWFYGFHCMGKIYKIRWGTKTIIMNHRMIIIPTIIE